MLCKVCNKKKAFARDKCWECLVNTEITEEQAKEIIEKL